MMVVIVVVVVIAVVVFLLALGCLAAIDSTENAKCRRARFLAGKGFTLPGEEVE